MALGITVIQATAGKLPILGRLLQHKGVNSVFTGGMRAAGLGIGTGLGYYTYGQTYGAGTAFIYGALSANPITGLPLGIAEIAYETGKSAIKRQNLKRKSSFKVGFEDKYGTINQMRMFSIQQLSRDHSSRMRFIGNEARYFHR